jgi:hypothetical protein
MATGAGHTTLRRWIAGGAVAFALLGLPAAASAAGALGQAHSAAKTASSIIHASVPTKGKYLLIVWVRSRGKHSRLVDVYIKGHPMKSVVANPWWGAAVYYTLSLSPTDLAVRTVNAPPAVAVRATLSLRKSTSAAPSPSTSSPTTASGTSGGTASASNTSAAPPPAPVTTTPTPVTNTPPPDPRFGTTPIFSDNFQTDFQNGLTEPPTNTWGFDNWGGCGTGTLSTSNSNILGVPNYYLDGVNPDTTIHLSASGLQITAVPSPGGGYVSGQLDSAAAYGDAGFSAQYGEVEASIEMPSNPDGTPQQGVCPGFWLLGDTDIGGAGSGNPPGEIDIQESPAFGGGPGFPVFFDLHGTTIGGTTQTYSQYVGFGADDFTGFHVYSVAWTPTEITWSIDGHPYETASQTSLVAGASWADDYDYGTFHIIFSLAVGGWPCQSNPCTPLTSPQPYTMTVQWVKWFPLNPSS